MSQYAHDRRAQPDAGPDLRAELDEPVDFDFDDPSNPPMKFTPQELADAENKAKPAKLTVRKIAGHVIWLKNSGLIHD